MKYIRIFLLILLINCSNNDDSFNEESINSCRLENVSIAPMIFDNYVPYFSYLEDPFIGPGVANKRMLFEYDELDRISNITGGPARIPTGSGIEWIFYDLNNYEISYDGNKVIIDSQVQTVNGENKNEFVIINGKIVSKKIISTTNYIGYNVTEFTYEYFDEYVEEYREEELYRKFYFVNNNLIRIEQLFYDNSDNLAGKSDIVFSEFDDSINLMQGLFYVDGSFYLAFSKNVYKSITNIVYEYVNGDFIALSPGATYSYDLGINEDGTNAIFQQECN